MTSIADGSVRIQTSSESVPSPPSWFGEVVLLTAYLRKHQILAKISERMHFRRRRFGRYEAIDFVAILFGYALSGERTLEAFYERLQPFAVPFMALFERDQLPSRSALSRFLAALPEAPVEALRTLFLDDALERPLVPEQQTGGLTDRAGNAWVVFDIDGTREAARQRALPQTDDLPPVFRRLDDVCAPGYTGRKRGQVVRTRTVISQAHSFQWLGSFGNRGKEYTVLEHPLVQARLHLPPDQFQQRPESQTVRSLYDCPAIPVGSEGVRCRVVVATHPAGKQKSPVGVTRAGVVYELFFTTIPQRTFTACDVVELYLHRGAFEPTLSDEDEELDPDRWCSHAAWGQECWQVISQWTWNLRLELGHHLKPQPVRTTEFAPAIPSASGAPTSPTLTQGYDPPAIALPWKAGRFSGQDFTLQHDGVLLCPEGKILRPTEQRREADGSLRVLYSARIRDCRDCPVRKQCQWHGEATMKPRRISVLLHPLQVGPAPLFWRDWSRREHQRACIQLVRHQRMEVQIGPPSQARPDPSPPTLSRAHRAHYRLSWAERLARNARAPMADPVTIKLFGIPESCATALGLAMA